MYRHAKHRDFYIILRVSPTADESELRRAYRQAALQAHPDKPGGSSEAFRAVSAAFEVLSSPDARSMYDKHYRFVSRQTHRSLRSQVKFPPPINITSARQTIGQPKRARSTSCEAGPASKLRSSSAVLLLDPSQQTRQALAHLRDVLQSMQRAARVAALNRLPQPVRASLKTFMEAAGKLPETAPCSAQRVRSSSVLARRSGKTPLSGFSGVRAISTKQYKAYMDIKALRFYTRGYTTMEAAIDAHIILVHLRHALQSEIIASSGAWDRVADLKRICIDALASFGASEHELGLRIFVSLRADQWLGRGHHITSPIMCLSEALEVHARVLRARGTSWEAIRAEWVRFKQQKQRSQKRAFSGSEAEHVVDAARRSVLERHFARTARKAALALHVEQMKRTRLLKKQARRDKSEKRQARLVAMAAAAERRRETEERWRWLRRRDLTTEELLRGPPRQKQES